MISIVNYLFEGKVKEHFKKNWGKYAAGAGAVTSLALAPEAMAKYHEHKDEESIRNITKIGRKYLSGQNKLPELEQDVEKTSALLKDAQKQAAIADELKNAPYNVFSKFRTKEK